MSYDAYKTKAAPVRLALFTGKGCAPCAQLKSILTKECEAAGVELAVFDIADERGAVVALGLRAVPTLVLIKEDEAQVLATGAIKPAMVTGLVAGVAR